MVHHLGRYNFEDLHLDVLHYPFATSVCSTSYKTCHNVQTVLDKLSCELLGVHPSYGCFAQQRPNHPGLEPRLSAPPGPSSQYPSSQHPYSGYMKGSESLASMPRGGSIGQVSQAGPSLIGRMPSGNASVTSAQAGSYTSGPMHSPFIPASTSQPIIGGAASQYSMPLAPGKGFHPCLESCAQDFQSLHEGILKHLGFALGPKQSCSVHFRISDWLSSLTILPWSV